MKTARLISIIMVLLERRHITARELSEMFEVSMRTIYRDIDSINLAGVPVISLQGTGGGISLSDKFKFEKRLFTMDDISSILAALGIFGSGVPGFRDPATLAKVRALIPTANLDEIERRSGSVVIDVSPWYRMPADEATLTAIRNAAEECNVIAFRYVAADGKSSEREIEPIRIMMKEAAWYVQGWCRLRNEARTFKISRMADVKITGETFSPRADALSGLAQTLCFNEEMIYAKLRVSGDAMKALLDYCPQECFTQTGEDVYIADITLPAGKSAYTSILSFGSSCEVLEPESLRRGVMETLTATLEKYSPKSLLDAKPEK